jgi:hypothetical protein
MRPSFRNSRCGTKTNHHPSGTPTVHFLTFATQLPESKNVRHCYAAGAVRARSTINGFVCFLSSLSVYRRGFNTTVASGGKVNSIEHGRPWLSAGWDWMPGALPRLLPA